MAINCSSNGNRKSIKWHSFVHPTSKAKHRQSNDNLLSAQRQSVVLPKAISGPSQNDTNPYTRQINSKIANPKHEQSPTQRHSIAQRMAINRPSDGNQSPAPRQSILHQTAMRRPPHGHKSSFQHPSIANISWQSIDCQSNGDLSSIPRPSVVYLTDIRLITNGPPSSNDRSFVFRPTAICRSSNSHLSSTQRPPWPIQKSCVAHPTDLCLCHPTVKRCSFNGHMSPKRPCVTHPTSTMANRGSKRNVPSTQHKTKHVNRK